MKLGSGKATPTPAAEPELPPADDLGSEPEQSPVQPPVEPEAGPAENPLEKQPFDAGVDADEHAALFVALHDAMTKKRPS